MFSRSILINLLFVRTLSIKMAPKYFAIRRGRRTGIFYSSWDKVQPYVHGYPQASFKSFRSESEAIAFLHAERPNSQSAVGSSVGAKRSLEISPDSVIEMSKVPLGESSESIRRRYTSSSAIDSPEVSIGNDSILIYTDGCCLGNTNVKSTLNPAGWGFVVISGGDGLSDEGATCLDERYGPVELDAMSSQFLGAKHASNNVAELSAIGQALKYVLDKYPSDLPHVVIRYDSEYAAKSVLGIWNGELHFICLEVCKLCREGERRADP